MNAGKAILPFVFAFAVLPLAAQPAAGGLPWGLAPDYIDPLKTMSAHRLTPPDMERIRQEDERNPGFRYTAPMQAELDLHNSGQWTTLPNGDRFWTLKLHAPGARALAVLYDDFYLPPGARLFMYSEDGKQVLGAYTQRNNSRTNRFLTGFIHGETALLEYFEPASQYGEGWLRIFRVDYAYRPLPDAGLKNSLADDFGFGASWTCHPNVACPPGDTLLQQQRSVCRILMVLQQGIGDCTGTLINNTANNGVPYVISAFHCMDGYTPMWDLWRFDFRYQSTTCANPGSEPAFQSLLGCDYRAGRRENDFLLMELFYSIPTSYQAFFAGWDRSPVVPARSVFMHHPLGDIKKISVDTHAAIIFNAPIQWNNGVTTPIAHHFRLRPDIGSFQVGSSGAGLFNQNKRFVGQLHGGYSSCDSTVAYFGRMTLAWNGGGSSLTRLRDWLDPALTEPSVLNGIENPANPTIALSGIVRTEGGAPIPGVKVWVEGVPGDTLTSDASGEFVFPMLDPGRTYALHFLKDNHHINGVSTQDVIRIQRQILGIENLSSGYKQFAADVNVSGGVSTLDVIHIRRLILSIADRFPDITSWQFFPANHSFSDSTRPFAELTPNRVDVGPFFQNATVYITGVKSGDVNESANPGN